MLLVPNSIIVIPKVNHTSIIFPWSLRSLPTEPDFKRVLTKAFCQGILNLMPKKKLCSFNDLINTYFRSIICFPDHEHSPAGIFCKVSLALLNRIQPILERVQEDITKPWNLQPFTDLIGANICIHSNSTDWLFRMSLISKINLLMKKSMLFWKDR